MSSGRRQVLIASIWIVVLFACVDVYPQVADRTSVVINEISPASGGRSSAWIEFFNPQEVPVVLAGLMVGNGDGEEFVIPDDFADLPAHAYLVVWFDDTRPAGTVITNPLGRKIEVWAPADQSEAWIPAHGVLTLFERRGHAKPEVIDYVAWGKPGKTWSVPLAEGFGVYDPATRLRPGDSIGLYPVLRGTPEHWVIYSDPEACEPGNVLNPCEVTPGLPNAIPRPKAFTPANGSTLGANSVGFGWARRPLDEGFRLEMARDPQFDDLMFSLSVRSSSIRLGWSLEPGRYFVRNFAQSSGRWSVASPTYTFAVADSACGDVPITAYQYPEAPMTPPAGWCTDIEPEKCMVLENIEFKYQRKDSKLFCALCPAGGRNKPHQSCVTFVLRDSEWLGGEAFFWLWPACFGNPPPRYSRSCSDDVDPWRDWYRTGEHGLQYCVPASVSMIASAYGKCLSQDRIAYQIHSQSSSNIPPWNDLGHKMAMGCTDGGECDDAVRFALGLLPTGSGGIDPAGFERRSRGPAETVISVSFDDITGWINDRQPLMIAADDPQHASVIAGYCAEKADDGSENKWLFVYDPIAGPLLLDATSVLEATDVLWVFPKVNVTMHSWASLSVTGDEIGVWNDWDNDGIVDFDEALRFATSPFCKVTNPDGTSDWAALQAAIQEEMDTEEYPALDWSPWNPWMACPWTY